MAVRKLLLGILRIYVLTCGAYVVHFVHVSKGILFIAMNYRVEPPLHEMRTPPLIRTLRMIPAI